MKKNTENVAGKKTFTKTDVNMATRARDATYKSMVEEDKIRKQTEVSLKGSSHPSREEVNLKHVWMKRNTTFTGPLRLTLKAGSFTRQLKSVVEAKESATPQEVKTLIDILQGVHKTTLAALKILREVKLQPSAATEPRRKLQSPPPIEHVSVSSPTLRELVIQTMPQVPQEKIVQMIRSDYAPDRQLVNDAWDMVSGFQRQFDITTNQPPEVDALITTLYPARMAIFHLSALELPSYTNYYPLPIPLPLYRGEIPLPTILPSPSNPIPKSILQQIMTSKHTQDDVDGSLHLKNMLSKERARYLEIDEKLAMPAVALWRTKLQNLPMSWFDKKERTILLAAFHHLRGFIENRAMEATAAKFFKLMAVNDETSVATGVSSESSQSEEEVKSRHDWMKRDATSLGPLRLTLKAASIVRQLERVMEAKEQIEFVQLNILIDMLRSVQRVTLIALATLVKITASEPAATVCCDYDKGSIPSVHELPPDSLSCQPTSTPPLTTTPLLRVPQEEVTITPISADPVLDDESRNLISGFQLQFNMTNNRPPEISAFITTLYPARMAILQLSALKLPGYALYYPLPIPLPLYRDEVPLSPHQPSCSEPLSKSTLAQLVTRPYRQDEVEGSLHMKKRLQIKRANYFKIDEKLAIPIVALWRSKLQHLPISWFSPEEETILLATFHRLRGFIEYLPTLRSNQPS
jgi:hypothetical protein